jgi:hypothetical protein
MFHLNFVRVEIHFLDHYKQQHFSYVGHRPLSVVQLANMQPSGKVFAAFGHLNSFSNAVREE